MKNFLLISIIFSGVCINTALVSGEDFYPSERKTLYDDDVKIGQVHESHLGRYPKHVLSAVLNIEKKEYKKLQERYAELQRQIESLQKGETSSKDQVASEELEFSHPTNNKKNKGYLSDKQELVRNIKDVVKKKQVLEEKCAELEHQLDGEDLQDKLKNIDQEETTLKNQIEENIKIFLGDVWNNVFVKPCAFVIKGVVATCNILYQNSVFNSYTLMDIDNEHKDKKSFRITLWPLSYQNRYRTAYMKKPKLEAISEDEEDNFLDNDLEEEIFLDDVSGNGDLEEAIPENEIYENKNFEDDVSENKISEYDTNNLKNRFVEKFKLFIDKLLNMMKFLWEWCKENLRSY